MSSEVTKYAWDKKKRTVLRSIKPGDYFFFVLPEGECGIGRIISKVSMGHCAEIFDGVVERPEFSSDWGDLSVSFL